MSMAMGRDYQRTVAWGSAVLRRGAIRKAGRDIREGPGRQIVSLSRMRRDARLSTCSAVGAAGSTFQRRPNSLQRQLTKLCDQCHVIYWLDGGLRGVET